MSDYPITLPADIYNALLVAAQSSNMTPAAWIAAQLPKPPTNQFAQVADLIGAIDSHSESPATVQSTLYGEMIAAKLAKQGIRKP